MIEKFINFIFGSRAYAATADELLRLNDRTVASGTGGDIYTFINSIMDRIPAILGGLAFLGLLYSGFLYVLALGDPTKMESAKKNITWIFTGIIAIAVILIVMKVLINITGRVQLNSSPF